MQKKLKPWHSMAVLFGPATLTEKLDGHTVGIHIEPVRRNPWGRGSVTVEPGDVMQVTTEGRAAFYRVWVQDRSRLVTPEHDIHGVAAWAHQHSAGLVEELGEGVHFGEWWGYKICRGYGLPKGDRRLSMFNLMRWGHLDGTQVPGLYSVPLLWRGDLGDNWTHVTEEIDKLLVEGSRAVPGYRYPEGTVLYHHDGDVMMKHVFAQNNRRNARRQA